MQIGNWLIQTFLGYQAGVSKDVVPNVSFPNQLEVLSKTNQTKNEQTIPDDILHSIFELLTPDPQKSPSFINKEIKDLLHSSLVSLQWQKIANDHVSRYVKKILRIETLPKGLTGAQCLRLLSNWKNQEEKRTFRTTSRPPHENFKLVEYHRSVDNPPWILDKIVVYGTRVILGSYSLIARKDDPTKADKGTIMWVHPIQNPEAAIFVSRDKMLIATQHYFLKTDKNKKEKLNCRFDVRHLQTGQLVGQVKIACQGNKKKFNQTHIEFDIKKFSYQKEGKVYTRHYTTGS